MTPYGLFVLERVVFATALLLLVGAGALLPSTAGSWMTMVGVLLAWITLKSVEHRALGEGYRRGWKDRLEANLRQDELRAAQFSEASPRDVDSGGCSASGDDGAGR